MLLLPFILFLMFAQPPLSQDAETVLREANASLQRDPGNPRVLLLRGIALAQSGQEQDGLLSIDKALTVSPKFVAALEAGAEIAYRTGDRRAKDYLSRILQQDPTNAPAHGMSGALAFEARDCGKAIQHFAAAEAAIRNNSLALAQWGECLVTNDQPGPGADRLRQVLALKPANAPGIANIRYDFALALFLSGKYDESIEAAQSLPAGADRENLLGSVYAAQEKIPQAIAALRQAITLEPTSERNYNDLASVCLDHQSFDVAEDVVNAGLSNIPDSAALYTLRGAIAAQTSNVEQSAADFERASRLQPDRSYGDVGLTLLLRQQDQIDRAIAVIRPRLARSPGDAALTFLLADLLMRKSEDSGKRAEKEARSLLVTAIRSEPDMAKAHSALGKLLFQAGEPEQAAKELKRALDLDPDDRVALNQYILVLRRLGRTEEATEAAQRLRDVFAAARKTEVRKNRYRLVRLSPAATTP